MGLEDIRVDKESDRFYWIKLNNKLFNTGYKFCMNECGVQDDISEIENCYDYCYTHFMVGKKQVMHQAQDSDEQTFTECLSKNENYDDLNSILKCSQNMHSGKMLIIADSIKRT